MRMVFIIALTSLALTACHTSMTSVSNTEDAWIFVDKAGPLSEFDEQAIYYCTAKSDAPICTRAKVQN